MFGKRKYNKSHPVERVWLVGLIEKNGDMKVKLFRVENRNKTALTSIVENNVNKKTTIYSDCQKRYAGLSCVGFRHETMNHSNHFVVPVSGVHTNTIEGTWSDVKLNVPYRCRTKKLIDPFLVRYMIVKMKRQSHIET